MLFPAAVWPPLPPGLAAAAADRIAAAEPPALLDRPRRGWAIRFACGPVKPEKKSSVKFTNKHIFNLEG